MFKDLIQSRWKANLQLILNIKKCVIILIMSQPEALSSEKIKANLQNYGILIGYSAIGMIGFGFFSFKLITTRQANMQKYKKKSKVPALHPQMKRLGLIGLIGLGIYSYGLSQIVKILPESQTNIQMRDYSELSDVNKNSPELQDHYVLQTMKLFGVSEHLIQKTKKQFKQMGQHPPQSESLNKELLGAVIEKKKMSRKFEQINSKNK